VGAQHEPRSDPILKESIRLTAIDQMKQAGVTITSGAAAFMEMLHDNANAIAGQFYAALDLTATRYILQITQGAKSRR
jgi:hypothetical protein